MPINDLREDVPSLRSFRIREIATVECVSCGHVVGESFTELRPIEIINVIKAKIRNGTRWTQFNVITPRIIDGMVQFQGSGNVEYTWFDMGKWVQKMRDGYLQPSQLLFFPPGWETIRGYYGDVMFNPRFDAGEMTSTETISNSFHDTYQGTLVGVRMFLCGTCRGSCGSCMGPTNDSGYLDPDVRGWDTGISDIEPGYCGSSSCMDNLCECDNCNRRFTNGVNGWTERDYMDSDGDIGTHDWCLRCTRGYTWCDEHECYEPDNNISCRNDHVIGGWRSNPEFIFHSFSRLGSVVKNRYCGDLNFPNAVYLGMELECAPGYGVDRTRGARMIHKEYKDRVWLKTDGSVGDGMEICTHPMTLEYFRSLDWSKFEELLEMGWQAWDDDRCGIHVHVGRNCFMSDSHLWKFAEMIVGNPRQVQKFAGRGSGTYHDYSGLKKGVSNVVSRGQNMSSKRWQDKVGLFGEGGFRPQHYHAVNLANANTVEVRIFRSTLKVRRVLANMEFVDACVEYTKKITAADCLKDKALSWQKFFEWLDGKPQYLELRSFFKEGGEEYIPIEPTTKKVKVKAVKKVIRREVVLAS